VGDYSSFRLVNGFGQAADVYADIVLDTGRRRPSSWSGRFRQRQAEHDGLRHVRGRRPGSGRVYGTEAFKGRAIITVWAPATARTASMSWSPPSIYTKSG